MRCQRFDLPTIRIARHSLSKRGTKPQYGRKQYCVHCYDISAKLHSTERLENRQGNLDERFQVKTENLIARSSSPMVEAYLISASVAGAYLPHYLGNHQTILSASRDA